MPPRDIFISYRNDGAGNSFAEKLASDLKTRGYSVYFNSHERRSGAFDERLRTAIASCKDFLLVVSAGCLERLLAYRPGTVDWVREEVLEARRHAGSVTITPVYLEGVDLPAIDAFSHDPDMGFLPMLDGVVMPADGYDTSPFGSLLGRLRSSADGSDNYRDLANGNPSYRANEVLVETLGRANAGDYEAMYLSGLMLYYSFGVDGDGRARRDLKGALHWFERVSREAPESMGLIKACANNLISKMYYQGDPVPQSYERCLEFLMKARQDPSAMMSAAYMRGIGLGCEWDYAAAEEFYTSNVGSYGFTLEDLASFYEARGRFADAERTYLRIESLSSHGNYRLGLIYKNGSHLSPPSPDYVKASLYLQRAREEGHVVATYELGNLYFRPIAPFPKDFRRAGECFREAADAGYMQAQYTLAYMLEYGHVERNVDEAIRYYELAARQGHVLSSESLARLYQTSGHLNYRRAYKHCEYAALHEDPQAEFMLGVMLLLGRGCDYDVAQARHWMERAESHGFMQAHLMLAALSDEGDDDYMPSWLA